MSNSAQPLPALPLSVRRPQITFPAGAFSDEAKAKLHNGSSQQATQGSATDRLVRGDALLPAYISGEPGFRLAELENQLQGIADATRNVGLGLPRNAQEEFEAQAAGGKVNVLRHFSE